MEHHQSPFFINYSICPGPIGKNNTAIEEENPPIHWNTLDDIQRMCCDIVPIYQGKDSYIESAMHYSQIQHNTNREEL